MRSKAIFMALLAFAFQAQAVPVSVDQAKAAARAWASAGRHLNTWIGTQAETVLSRTTAQGATFHVVRMAGGGTVITSGDTEVEPIVAFTTKALTEEALDPKGPLYALLKRDLEIRHQVAPSTGLAYGPSAFAAKRATSATANTRKWSELIAAGTVRDPRLSYGLAADPLSVEPSDLRVGALMRTEWSQAGGIWNYYTPGHAVCGCVATAAAQVMRYLHGTPDENGMGGLEIPFPVESVEQKTVKCQYKGKDIELTMQGGTYCWTNMPFTAAEARTDEQKRNIGKLTSDVGISVGMMYEEPSGAGSGAVYRYVAERMLDTFGYRQVSWVSGESLVDAEDSSGLERQTLFANFDAGRPCLVGIPGHAIVADGYGYDGDLAYTHLNMGWAGSGDMWYNLPDMTAAGEKYTLVDDIGYNVFPEIGGKDEGDETKTTHGILSGRVLDDDGKPVPGCAVTVRRTEDGVTVTNLVTGETGIWAAILPAGKYDAEALTDDRQWIGTVEGILLAAPYFDATVAEPGNSWGNDITLEHPSVRLGAEIFSSIDRAVEAARGRAAAAPDETFVLEVVDNTWLKKTQVIDFKCAIVATNEDPSASSVTRRQYGMPRVDAAFEVATNGFLSISNVVFAGSGKTLVSVASNGVVAVAGLVDFGVSYDTVAIRTAASDGFMLAGALARGFVLDCAAAREVGQVCGFGHTTSQSVFEGITNTADRIANASDPRGETRARVVGGPDDYQLVWGDIPVPLEESVGYYVGADDVTNTAGQIDRLFERFEADVGSGACTTRCVTVLRGGALSRPLTVSNGMKIVGEGDSVLTVAGTAGFTLTGGKLEVSGLVFSNYVGNALFLVNGAGAELDIGAGTVFTDIKGTNKWSGAVTVLKGSATIGGGVRFANCQATGRTGVKRVDAYGGAVYLGSGCTLALGDCTMTNCVAQNLGGAVYALDGSKVSLSGTLAIAGNTSGTRRQADDVYLKGDATLTLAGAVTGAVGIRRSKLSGAWGNDSGNRCATAVSAAVAHESADALFNDVNAGLKAEPDDANVALRWTERPVGPQPWTGDPDQASARVIYGDGTTNLYLLTSEALEAVTDDATVEIIGWEGNYIASDLEIRHAVTLRSDVSSGLYPFERRGNCSIRIVPGGSLTLQDVEIHGCALTNELDETEMPTGAWLRAKPDEWTAKPVFDVAGGSLTLKTPSDPSQTWTEILGVYGDGARNAGAVCVWNNGTFTMESGTAIHDCVNLFENNADGSGRGGAVLVDNGTANLSGGTIEDCCANNGGGVFIGNGAAVNVSGDMVIAGNFRLDGVTPNNLVVYDCGKMVLTGPLTGSVGYTEGVAADDKFFGRVAETFSGSLSNMVESAHNFTHDTNGDVGMVVENGSERRLVWSAALDEDGTYVDKDADSYSLVRGAELEVDPPTAVTGLVYDGTEKTGVEFDFGYALTGHQATDAGDYTATAKLRPGFVWTGGTTGDKPVDWSIAKATCDMSGVFFASQEFVYNGKPHALAVSGDLPDGVSVAYANNSRTEVGSTEVTATFAVDAAHAGNWKLADGDESRTAMLTVVNPGGYPPQPPSGEDPIVVDPDPIAFESITREADGSSTLVVTNLKKGCNYRLIWTDDLTKGFVNTGAWEQATQDGPWSTNVLFATPAPAATFWKAEGKEGTITE